MKATGIVRRIDDLGRVVIPKEIRRTLHIKEGDPLELFLEGSVVCFKKYNTSDLFAEALDDLLELLKAHDMSSCITEEDRVLVQSTVDYLKAKWKKEQEKESEESGE